MPRLCCIFQDEEEQGGIPHVYCSTIHWLIREFITPDYGTRHPCLMHSSFPPPRVYSIAPTGTQHVTSHVPTSPVAPGTASPPHVASGTRSPPPSPSARAAHSPWTLPVYCSCPRPQDQCHRRQPGEVQQRKWGSWGPSAPTLSYRLCLGCGPTSTSGRRPCGGWGTRGTLSRQPRRPSRPDLIRSASPSGRIAVQSPRSVPLVSPPTLRFGSYPPSASDMISGITPPSASGIISGITPLQSPQGYQMLQPGLRSAS